MERGVTYNANEHVQPKNVAQIISGNIHALDRLKHSNPNYGSNYNTKLKEQQQLEMAENEAKRRPNSYNEFNRTNSQGVPASSPVTLTSH